MTPLHQTYPALASERHPTLNLGLTPADVSHGMTRKVWWLCSQGHGPFTAWIHGRARGSGCPKCFSVRASKIRKGRPCPWVTEQRKGKKHLKGCSCRSCEALRKYARSQQPAPPEIRKARRLETNRACLLKSRYGITLTQYNELFLKQNGVCAICKKACSTGKRLAVDHDHKTRRIRGLLCRQCNRGIGHFEDEPALLKIAAEYVESV